MVICYLDLILLPALRAPDPVLPDHILTHKLQLIPPGSKPPTASLAFKIKQNKTPPTYKYAGGWMKSKK
jgi:hypothetical protein